MSLLLSGTYGYLHHHESEAFSILPIKREGTASVRPRRRSFRAPLRLRRSPCYNGRPRSLVVRSYRSRPSSHGPCLPLGLKPRPGYPDSRIPVGVFDIGGIQLAALVHGFFESWERELLIFLSIIVEQHSRLPATIFLAGSVGSNQPFSFRSRITPFLVWPWAIE
jgi:hypothetical protein